MPEDQAAAIEAAAKLVESQTVAGDVITLSNGIKLRCKPVPQMIMRQIFLSHKKPEPPIIHNEEKGRNEPWEGDPLYQQQLEDWEMQLGEVTLNVAFSVGTSIEKVPKGMYKPDDDGWFETLEAAGMEIKRNSPAARYLSWLRLYAAVAIEDAALISAAVAAKSGVTEKDVETSLQSFRSGENGRGDLATDASERSEDRDNLPTPSARRSSRNRGTG